MSRSVGVVGITPNGKYLYITEYVNEFFKSSRITEKVYDALLNYKVEIDD